LNTAPIKNSTDKIEGKAMPIYTPTDYEPVPPGLYTARLEKIEEATSPPGIYYR
jgi:hypothetical protein